MNSYRNPSAINKILIVGPAWIGDMVMAHTLFKLIKARDPHVEIDVLAPSWTLPLINRMPEINKGILFPFGHGSLQLRKRFAFAKQLRSKKYDQAIVLPCSFKSALTALWAKIPLRTGWLGEWRFGVLNDVRRLNKQQLPLMVQQFAALGIPEEETLAPLQPYYPQLKVDEGHRQVTLEKLGLTTQKPILAFCPGAEFGPAKRWPIESFAKVALHMLAKDWQVWIFGSNKDKELAEYLVEATNGKCVDLTGKTSLVEAIDLLSLAKTVVSNDSGLMHIAAALSRPLIALYGSSTPHFTPPLSDCVKIINLSLACSPCFKRTCPLEHFNCMKKISPDQVITTINSLNYD